MNGIVELLTPDLVKIKANFLPTITINPKVETPVTKIFKPKIYLVKGDYILKLDPQTKTIKQVTQDELKKEGMNIIDFFGFGLFLFLLYKGIRVFFKKG